MVAKAKKKRLPAGESPSPAPAEESSRAAAEPTPAFPESPSPLPPENAPGPPETDPLGRFLGVDPRALGVFRVAFGLVLLGDLGLRFPYRSLLYANEGILANHFLSFAPPSRPDFTVFGAFSTTPEVTVAFVLTGLVYLLYTVGFHTRVQQILAVVLVTGLVARNPLANPPGDPFLCALAVFSAFLPLGNRFSWDAVQKSLAGRRELAVHALGYRASALSDTTSVAALGVTLQTALVLGFSAATDYRDHGLHWALFHDVVATPLGGALRSSAPLVAGLSALLQGLSAAAALTLLAPRTYPRVALASLALTWLAALGLGSLLCLGILPFALAAAALLRLPASFFEAAERRLAHGIARATVVFSATDAGLLGVFRLLSRLDVYERLTFVDRADVSRLPPDLPEGVVALYENGVWHVGTAALASAVRVLPGGGGVAPLLGSPPGRALLRAVLKRRAKLALSLGFPRGSAFSEGALEVVNGVPQVVEGYDVLVDDPPAPLTLWARQVSASAREFFAGTLLLLVVLEALGTSPATAHLGVRAPAALSWVLAYPRITQRWGLLAPFQERRDGVLVIDITLGDGTHLDPFTGKPPVRDRLAQGRYGDSALWTAYTQRIRRPDAAVYRDELKRAIRAASRAGGKDTRVSQAEVLWVSRPSPEPGQPLATSSTEESLFGNR